MLCLFEKHVDYINSSTNVTDLYLIEDESILEVFTYAALGFLIPGLFLVLLGLCFRKSSEINDEE